jgi:hypothetical protein
LAQQYTSQKDILKINWNTGKTAGPFGEVYYNYLGILVRDTFLASLGFGQEKAL